MKKISTVSILFIALFSFWSCSDKGDALEMLPNFVWIISEDNSTHYEKLFDEHGIETPAIEALAKDGIIFRNAYSNGAVCSVARSTLISACYAPRIGAQYHRKELMVPMPEGIKMFPSYLRDAGYYTTNCSKEDYNIVKDDGVWDESSRKAHWRNREEGQPFFHKASYGQSHEGSLHFKEKMMRKYTPSTELEDVFVFPTHPDTELFRYTGAYYRDRIVLIDSIVADVVSQLEEDGLLESTFIFYFGDHGGVLPGSKGYINESGIHVPLVVRIPEKFKYLVKDAQGTYRDDFVEFVDFGPSILELAGIDLPAGIDGEAFLLDKKEAKKWEEKEVVYSYGDRFDEKYDQQRSLRKGNLKYVRNYQPFIPEGLQNNYRYKSLAYQEWRNMFLDGELNDVQAKFFLPKDAECLFDLESDPYETKNLANDPTYANELVEMRTLLIAWVKDMPDLSFYPESELIKRAFDNPAGFGQQHKDQIAALVDISDLVLLEVEIAGEEIDKALTSDDAWERYWGLIVCSSFGEEAIKYRAKAEELLQDEELLVQMRAAEFLAILGEKGMDLEFRRMLSETEDDVEASLILNSVTMLRDAPYNYMIALEKGLFKQEAMSVNVEWRLDYLIKN